MFTEVKWFVPFKLNDYYLTTTAHLQVKKDFIAVVNFQDLDSIIVLPTVIQ